MVLVVEAVVEFVVDAVGEFVEWIVVFVVEVVVVLVVGFAAEVPMLAEPPLTIRERTCFWYG